MVERHLGRVEALGTVGADGTVLSEEPGASVGVGGAPRGVRGELRLLAIRRATAARAATRSPARGTVLML